MKFKASLAICLLVSSVKACDFTAQRFGNDDCSDQAADFFQETIDQIKSTVDSCQKVVENQYQKSRCDETGVTTQVFSDAGCTQSLTPEQKQEWGKCQNRAIFTNLAVSSGVSGDGSQAGSSSSGSQVTEEKAKVVDAYSYVDNGDSWAKDEKYPACGKGKTQSPIALNTTMQSKQEEYFVKHYDDISPDWNRKFSYKSDFKNYYGEQYWSEKSSAVYAILDNKGLGTANAPTPQPVAPDFFYNQNWFNSSEASQYEADTLYYTKQLHFHAQSEHTIDGKLMDIEMHIVHQSANETADKHDSEDKDVQEKKWPLGKLAVIGILFDTKNYDEVSWETVQVIDNFFESLMRGSDVQIGQLMAVLDTQNRWVYSGSLTTPPCYENVYWNVLKTVYPIKPEHLIYYRSEKLEKKSVEGSYAKENGNYRKARPPAEEHDLRLLRPMDTFEKKDENSTAQILAIFLLIAVLVALFFAGYICFNKGKASNTSKVAPNGPGDVEMQKQYMTANDNSTINLTTYNQDLQGMETAKNQM